MRVAEITPADNIQANLDAIAKEGGGKLVMTPGEYLVTGTIHIPRGVQIEGIGGMCTPVVEDAPVVIRHEPSEPCDLFVTDYPITQGYRRIAPISGLSCFPGKLSKACFRLESCSTFLLSRCAAVNFPVGFIVQACICSTLEDCYAEGVYASESYPLLFIAGPHPTTTMVVNRCRLRRGMWGVRGYANSLHDLLIDSPVIESCVEGGLCFDGGGAVTIRNLYPEEVGAQVLRHRETTRVTMA